MDPTIKLTTPPNFLEILDHLPSAQNGRTIFAYAPYIYNPYQMPIAEELIAHEMKHIERQGECPEIWWEHYLNVPMFRLIEEMHAHMAEARNVLERLGSNRLRRRIISNVTGERLSSGIYGYNDLITRKQAIKFFKDRL